MPKIIYSIISLNPVLNKIKPSKVCVVTSAVLVKKLKWAIGEINFPDVKIILVPDGEKAKEWNELHKLLASFSELHLDRNSIVIALGGGTVGDLVGFAASIYLRGINYVQIPTTLVAQVDSAHGGKTGINFLKYKNQIGTFAPALATVVDIRFIRHLSRAQVADGLGEIIKAGLIKDATILSILRKETLNSLPESPRLDALVRKSIAVKLFYTDRDFKDTALRQMLNAGHTVGHAVELKYEISHGQAVIFGLIEELRFTESLGLSEPSVRIGLLKLLKNLGIKIDAGMKADWSSVLHDKKIAGKTIQFPVIQKEGESKVIELKLDKLKKFIEND